jgi:hypothetical protein
VCQTSWGLDETNPRIDAVGSCNANSSASAFLGEEPFISGNYTCKDSFASPTF